MTCSHVFVCTVVYELSCMNYPALSNSTPPASPRFYLTDPTSPLPLHWGKKQKADTMLVFVHNYRSAIIRPAQKFSNTQSQRTFTGSIFNWLRFRGFHVNYPEVNLLKWLFQFLFFKRGNRDSKMLKPKATIRWPVLPSTEAPWIDHRAQCLGYVGSALNLKCSADLPLWIYFKSPMLAQMMKE